MRLQLIVENAERRFQPGTLATVLIAQVGEEPALVVPQDTIFERGQLSGVYVVDDDSKARLRWVVPGETSDEQVTVLSGLSASDTLVRLSGADCVAEGRRLEVTR